VRRQFGVRPRIIALAVLATVVAALAVSGVVTAVGAGDDNIPGVPLPASPVAGALDDHTDFDDVYAVPLKFNQKLDVSMTGKAGSQFDLWLWSPSSKSILVDSPASRVVQSSQDPASSTEQFWYPARSTGTYYLHVFNPLDSAASSTGTYNLTYRVTTLPAPALDVKAPSVIGWGQSASIVGTATLNGAPIAGARVLVQSMAAGTTSWKDLNFDSGAYAPKTTTSSSGAFTFSVKPTKKTQYRVVVWPAENRGWRFGSPLTITPRIKLGSPHVPSSAKRGAKFTAYGYLAPRHLSGAKTVTLTFQKGSTVVRVKAVNSNHSSAKWGTATKYKARVSLPKRGTWKVVASASGDSLHAATSSGVRYITVK